MHILFIDESGTPPKPTDNNPPYFVIAGIIIPEHSWHSMRDAMLGMKIRRNIRGEIKWRYFAPGNTDSKNPMRKLAHRVKEEIRLEVFEIIRSTKGVKTIAAITSAPAAYSINSITSQEELYHLTYKTLSERFQYYLQDISSPGKKELGIIVSDHRGAQDDHRLRNHHQRLLHSSAEFISTYENLIEGLFLEPSNLSVGIQFADMIGGAVWRRFQKNDLTHFNEIEPTLRRGPLNQINGFGLIKVPKKGWV